MAKGPCHVAGTHRGPQKGQLGSETLLCDHGNLLHVSEPVKWRLAELHCDDEWRPGAPCAWGWPCAWIGYSAPTCACS